MSEREPITVQLERRLYRTQTALICAVVSLSILSLGVTALVVRTDARVQELEIERYQERIANDPLLRGQ